MRKILLLVLVLMLISVAACQQAVKKEVIEKVAEIPKAEATGEAAVDVVGDDLSNINDVEKDLGTEELGDLDSGLADIQNI